MKRLVLSLALAGAVTAALAQAPSPAKAPADAKVLNVEQIDNAALAEKAARIMHGRGDLKGETRAWERAVKLRPHLGRYKFELAAAYAQQDMKRHAYNALMELQGQGYSYDISKDKRFDKVATTEVYDYLVKGFEANRARFGEGKLAYTLPKDVELLESLAWDPTRKQLLVGSAREGKVYQVGADGRLKALVAADKDNGMWAVFDIAVDAQRGVLWVASTAVPHYRGYNAETDLGRAGIFKFDLKTGKFLKKFLSPSIAGQAFFLSTLTLGKDGELYAADGVNNAVYQVRDDQFRRLFHAPRLASIRGMAVSGDGKILFLGDHERGVIGYELAAGKPFDIAVPKNLALGGIDGLAWWNGQLIVVQNNMQPNRVMRLKLADDARSITGVQALAVNQPEFSLPTLGTLAGDTYFFIANSQKGQYDRFGLAHDANKLEGVRIYQVKADYVPKDTTQTGVPTITQ